jgi:3-oxoacyl-[acyl-carrier-protein] synthase II
MLKNHNYNMTYCHRGFSFEEALIDAMMLIHDGQAKSVLIGGIDEITPNNFKFFNYLDYWKKDNISNKKLLEFNNPGTIAGEGACFFTINADNSDNASCISDLSLFYKPQNNIEIEETITMFLRKNNLTKENIDLVILGMNGDNNLDAIYKHLMNDYFNAESIFTLYKHLCGEYMTSSSFALWLADTIMRNQFVPDYIKIKHIDNKPINNILIYNHYRNMNHSLILVSNK